MEVKLISISKPIIEGVKTAEDLIVYCARVSNPSNQLNLNTGNRLLKYCAKHGHWSVFEQAFMTLEIKTSRAIAAQILRHRSFVFQEFSQRYASADSIEPIEMRQQALSNRQSSTQVIEDEDTVSLVNSCLKECFSLYDKLLKDGVARECARMVLPLATSTTLYMTGSVRSWIHYLQQRLSEHAQKEHRLVAEEIAKIFNQEFPITYKAIFGNEE